MWNEKRDCGFRINQARHAHADAFNVGVSFDELLYTRSYSAKRCPYIRIRLKFFFVDNSSGKIRDGNIGVRSTDVYTNRHGSRGAQSQQGWWASSRRLTLDLVDQSTRFELIDYQ